MNPVVKLDLTNHPYYSTREHVKSWAKIWDCEILGISFNTGNLRCRLFYPDSKKKFVGNFEIHKQYIVQDSITYLIREKDEQTI